MRHISGLRKYNEGTFLEKRFDPLAKKMKISRDISGKGRSALETS